MNSGSKSFIHVWASLALVLGACADDGVSTTVADTGTGTGDTAGDGDGDPTGDGDGDGDPTGDGDGDPATTGDGDGDPTGDGDGDPTGDGDGDPDPGNLCDRLGDTDGISALHVDFVGKVLNDQRINAYFLNDSVDGGNLLMCLDKQIGEAAGCDGVVYDCLDMLTTHAGMGISTLDFTDLAEDYSAALDDHQGGLAPNLTDQDKMDIIGILAGMAGDIVEDADSNLTVYQRVGRKPAIRDLIGEPGEVMSFVDYVANDVEINGFFGATDFIRLNTCLTRQISGIDGPAVYGAEVDSPGAGIDEGVAVDNKCLDMATVHEGMTDDMMSLITNDDFNALVVDLVSAMDDFAVDPADQAAVLGVLGPMCEIIVGDSPNGCPGNNAQEVFENLAVGVAPIPDAPYTGSIDEMACVIFDVPDTGLNFIDGVQVELGLTNDWVGDLTIKVESPDGTITTLMSRPGTAELADDGTGCGGDSSNIATAAPVVFIDGGATSAELMGSTINGAQTVCTDDMLCEYNPNAGAAVAGTLADLVGGPANGQWRVCVADGCTAAGSYDTVALTIDRVKFDPTP
jgi:subtilisin-like proprotein convertase family protein/truncated hemoglobin YjbI